MCIRDRFKDVSGILNASVKEIQAVKGLTKNKAYKVVRVCDKYKNRIEMEVF